VNQRLTAAQALESRWIEHKAPESEDVHIDKFLIKNMRAFHKENKIKQMVLHHMATQMDHSAIDDVRNIFMALDQDKDGHLTIEEFRNGIASANLAIPDELSEIIKNIDTDNNGFVDYTEFIAAAIDTKVHLQEHVCWKAFCAFDVDHDGFISREEFEQLLKNDDVHLVKDTDSSLSIDSMMGFTEDKIDFKEFMLMIRGPKGGRRKSQGDRATHHGQLLAVEYECL